MTKFIREIPEAKIANKELTIYEQNGFTLVWKENSVEVWYINETKPVIEVLK